MRYCACQAEILQTKASLGSNWIPSHVEVTLDKASAKWINVNEIIQRVLVFSEEQADLMPRWT